MTIQILTTVLTILSSATAGAYELLTCSGGNHPTWPAGDVDFRVSAVSFPTGGSAADAIQRVADQWNKSPADIDFTMTYGDSSVSRSNSENEIWATSSPFWSGGPAVASTTYRCGVGRRIQEVDVVYDASRVWVASRTKSLQKAYASSGNRSLISVGIHEFGHALGLQHEAGVYNIMGEDWNHVWAPINDSGGVIYTPGEDASDGAVALYGLAPTDREDIGVAHWKYDGPNGSGYSSHRRTQIYKLDGTSASSYTSDGEPVYEITRGHNVEVEFTFENNGTNSQSPMVYYVLSEDASIGTDDLIIATRTPTLNRNEPFTFVQEIEVPGQWADGTHIPSRTRAYIGVMVDPLDTIDEVRENNDRSYIDVEIQ